MLPFKFSAVCSHSFSGFYLFHIVFFCNECSSLAKSQASKMITVAVQKRCIWVSLAAGKVWVSDGWTVGMLDDEGERGALLCCVSWKRLIYCFNSRLHLCRKGRGGTEGRMTRWRSSGKEAHWSMNLLYLPSLHLSLAVCCFPPCSHFPIYSMAPSPHPTPTPSPPFLPLFRAQATHPGGTIACDFIPMHRSETSALRYGILSLNNKQVDQPKYTSEEIDKSTRFSLRLDPHPKGRERKEAWWLGGRRRLGVKHYIAAVFEEQQP